MRMTVPRLGGHRIASRRKCPHRPGVPSLEAGWQVANRPANPRVEHAQLGGVARCSLTDDEASVNATVAQRHLN
jgi:hypothetical protein